MASVAGVADGPVTFDSDLDPVPEAGARTEIVADLMSPGVGVFGPHATVSEATAALREQVKSAFITYLYVVDPDRRLLGLVVMREMLLAEPDATLEALMLRDVFTLRADLPLGEALKLALHKHFPVYPVVDAGDRLVGLVTT